MSWFFWSLLTALTWGCVPALEKLGLARMDPTVGLIYRCLGVVIGLVPLLVFQWSGFRATLQELPAGIAYLLAGGFLASVVGQIFFYHALKTGEVSRVVIIAGAYPVISFILGIIFLGEKMTLIKSLGVGFVLLGVILLK